MAKYVFTGTITIEGDNVKSKRDAITTLQVMLNDYEDCNSTESDTDIVIHWDTIERVKQINV